MGQITDVRSIAYTPLVSENVASHSRQSSATTGDTAERIQQILGTRGLTLYQVSQRSAQVYGRSSPYFIPHNLYYDLRRGSFIPTIFQVLAFSRISGYLLSDWLHALGINLEEIPRLQTLLPTKRTTLLDASLTDRQAWVRWFDSRPTQYPAHSITPLAQLLEPGDFMRIHAISASPKRTFLYAKIGTEDALAFPDLVPGTVVRASSELTSEYLPTRNGQVSHHIFLIEHSRGMFCCRLRSIRKDAIVPVSNQLGYAQIELTLSSEVRVLGTVDLEIRPLLGSVCPSVPTSLAERWRPALLSSINNFGQLLNRARKNAYLSFREAALVSREISELLKDHSYRIPPSSLCDYESLETPPRSIQKMLTLCCLYGLQLQTLLHAIGISMENTGTEPMPDNLACRAKPAGASDVSNGSNRTNDAGFLGSLVDTCGEVPFHLRNALGSFTGLKDVSLDDFFWIGGAKEILHPYLHNALLAVVNRRKKTPFHYPSKPIWKQPIYVLLMRNGTYLCSCCGLENGKLVIHPYTEHFFRQVEFGHRKDIEVIGQIVAIARRPG